MCPQSGGAVVGFISVTCDVDSKLLQEFHLSEFDGWCRQINDDDAAAESDSEEAQVTPLHPNTFSFHGNAALTQLSAALPSRRSLRGPDQEVLQMEQQFSRFSSLLLTRITR